MRGESEDRQFRWTVATKRHEDPVDPAKPAPAPSGTPTGAQPAPYGLYRVDARVEWKTAAGLDRSVNLSTLLLAQIGNR
jgi:hypothetical protein